LLADPDEYVRRVMENMMSGSYDRDEAVVRIGVSGTRVAPNYKIEYPAGQPEMAVLTIGADTYGGKGHKELRHLDDVERGEQWSTRATSSTRAGALSGVQDSQRTKDQWTTAAAVVVFWPAWSAAINKRQRNWHRSRVKW
jgi:hypothetical protein